MNEIQSGHVTYYIEEIQARRNYCAAQVGPTTFQCVAWFQSCVWRIATRADFTAHRLARVS